MKLTYGSIGARASSLLVLVTLTAAVPANAGLGDSSATPGVSCKHILDNGFSLGDGVYWIDPDGPTGSGPFQAYCDMTTDGGGWTLAVNSVPGSEPTTTDITVNYGAPTLTNGYVRPLSSLAISTTAEIRHYIDFTTAGRRYDAKYTGVYYSPLPLFASWTTLPAHIAGSQILLDRDMCTSCGTTQFGKPWQTGGSCVSTTAGIPWYYGSGLCWSSTPTNKANGPTQGPETTAVGGGHPACYSIFVRELNTPVYCGDGAIGAGEECDDGNAAAGDGCSAACIIEGDYVCTDEPSVCALNLTPGITCKHILTHGGSWGDGVYWIDPDGPDNGDPAFLAWCDMTTDGGGWTLGVNSVQGSEAPTTDMVSNTGTGATLPTGHTRDLPFAIYSTVELRHYIEFSSATKLFHAKYTRRYHDPMPHFAEWATMPGHIAGSEQLLDPSLCVGCGSTQFGKPWYTGGSCVSVNLGIPWYYGSSPCWGSIPTNLANGLSQGPETTALGGGVLDRYAIYVRELYSGPYCGDGFVEGTEECDDGGRVDGDGCSSSCTVESGFTCIGDPSQCGLDCNANDLPDTCDLDCTALATACDVAGCGLSDDCNADGRPDECGVDVTCDMTETAKLTASDRGSGDDFGISVSISGSVSIVGAYSDHCATGSYCGSAYVYRSDGTAWVQEQKLTAADPADRDYFGGSVAVHEDVAVVGVPLDDCGSGQDCGSAYVFRFDGSTWLEEQKLTASVESPSARFGHSVAVFADVIVVGAYADTCAAGHCGASYVFRHDGAGWVEEQKLAASDGATNDRFGYSVSITQDRIVVGADKDVVTAGVLGSAYVYKYTGGAWIEEQKLSTSGVGQSEAFGYSVSISGRTVLVGDPNILSPAGRDAGAAHVFQFDGVSWNLLQGLTPTDGAAYSYFGHSVSISDDRLLIGRIIDTCPAGGACGSAYVFALDGSTWIERQKLTSSDSNNGRLGHSVALSEYRALAGAPQNGCGSGGACGAVYVFHLEYDDCNCNGAADSCELAAGTVNDCDGDRIPDQCEMEDCAGDPSCGDCQGNGILDACELFANDCNFDNIPDDCQLSGNDCNLDGLPDECGTPLTCSDSEAEKLTASDAATGDEYGCAVSVNGNVAVVGAAADDCGAGVDCGAAYVVRFDGSAWVEEQKLTASDVAAHDNFGRAVAIDTDVAVVSSPNADCAAGINCGAAYVFRRDGGVWAEEQKLTALDGAASDWLGSSVTISGDLILLGARGDDCAVSGANCGAAYVYRYNGNSWVEEAKLIASHASYYDLFGAAVSASENTVLIGAYGDDCGAGSNCGSAYLYRFVGGTWVQERIFIASDAAENDTFGRAVSLSGNTAMIGAEGDGYSSGSVYVFNFNGTSWTEDQKLAGSDTVSYDFFGRAISLSGNWAIIGAAGDDCTDGDGCGAAYVFRYDGVAWVEQSKATASDQAASDQFGSSVSLNGHMALVGARLTDCGAGNDCGSAYIVDLLGADCNCNGEADTCEVGAGTAGDCNGDGLLDECEIASCAGDPTCGDCQPNGVPDGCELVGNDCDTNSTPDECDPDGDLDGVPDTCDPCPLDDPDDSDGDGICDSDDTCVGDDALIGQPCDSPVDADDCASGVHDCSSGTLTCTDDDLLDDADADGIWDCNDTCAGDDALIGQPCESAVDADNCASGVNDCSSGTLTCTDDDSLDDADGDGVWDCNDTCVGDDALIGQPCDSTVDTDNCASGFYDCSSGALSCTDDDLLDDADGDGVWDCEDTCAGDNALIGSPCDSAIDADDCATGIYDCTSGTMSCTDDDLLDDADADGIWDCDDTCVGDDALIGLSCDSPVDLDDCASGIYDCSTGTLACTDGDPLDDEDSDAVWDCNDDCPGTPVDDQVGTTGCSCGQLGWTAAIVDADADTVPDECDNCPDTPNADQADADADAIGDACDTCVGNDGQIGLPCDNPVDADDCASGIYECSSGTLACTDDDLLDDADGDGVWDCNDVCPDGDDNVDCQPNGTPDACDISGGSSFDNNGNGIPDECEFPDCNENGIDDAIDIAGLTSPDCDGNSTPDECQISTASTAPGGPFFCTADCDPDCNDTGIPDACELTDNDCNADNAPDECGVDASCATGEPQLIVASDVEYGDWFGTSVSVFADVAVLGAPADNQAACSDCGSTYVFRMIGGNWVEEQKLTASDAATGDEYGCAVSVNGNVAVVGAAADDCAAGVDCGAAYVVRFDGSAWVEEQKLTASDAAASDRFGSSVSVYGNVIVVGTPYSTCAAGDDCGSAYVFRFDGSVWTEEQKLTAADASIYDNLGFSVSTSGGAVVLGARNDACAAGGSCGSAYVYRFNGTSWIQEQTLRASDAGAGDGFGNSVSMAGNTVVVGARYADCPAASDCGSAYVFRFVGSSWIEEQKLTASDAVAIDQFGYSVGGGGDTVIVGAWLDDCAAGTRCGSAYLFRFNGISWVEEQKLAASDAPAGARAGWSVAVSGDQALVGAPYSECSSGGSCGSAYAFDLGGSGAGTDCNCNGEADVCEVKAGTANDCDGDGILDECEMADCTGDPACGDCQPNGTPDACDISSGSSPDGNGNGIPDECECLVPAAPALPSAGWGPAYAKSRYLSFEAGSPGNQTAIRVTCVDMPPPFDGLIGTVMWVGQVRDVSELGGSNDATPPTFQAAQLQCDALFADWGSLGTVHAYGELIVPGGTYNVQAVDTSCAVGAEESFSAPLALPMAGWADVVGGFDTGAGRWTGPNGSVDVAADVVAVLDKFGSLLTAPIKACADLEPALPDQKINITDVVVIIDAFGGAAYPFDPPPAPCGP